MATYEEANLNQGVVSTQVPLEKFERDLETYLFMKDKYFERILTQNPKYAPAYPFFSHTNQVSNISKKTAEIAELELESSLSVTNMFVEENDFDEGDWQLVQALIHKGKFDIHKAKDGWFFKEVKRRGRDVQIEEVQPKRGGIFGGLIRR